jgi:polyphosphate kinase
MIDAEAENARAGRPSGITLKMNSLVDEQVIDALYDASQAGVPIEIVVRGMCALRPGVPGLSSNIRVRSILGRFLEHSRVSRFAANGEEQVWIGSADAMHRNLDRRVEALVKVRDPAVKEELCKVLTLAVDANTEAWELGSDGTWTRRTTDAAGEPLLDYQLTLLKRAAKRSETRTEHHS